MALTFGEKIKESRKAQKLTQKQLAKLIGAAHNSISDWENNKNKPDPDTIELLCGVLKITPNYLLASSEDDFSPKEKAIIRKYRFISKYSADYANVVDHALDKGYSIAEHIQEQQGRIEELKNKLSEKESDAFLLNAAHADDYMGAPEELRKLEEDIMDDEDF